MRRHLAVTAVFICVGLMAAASALAAPTVTRMKTMPFGDTARMTTGPLATTLSPSACFTPGYYVRVRYTNVYGVTLWTYRQDVYAYVCGGYVRSLPTFLSRAMDSCCNWGWQGTVAKSHTSLPATYVVTYSEGHFRSCLPWPLSSVCEDKYPWARQRINYLGQRTGYDWGIY